MRCCLLLAFLFVVPAAVRAEDQTTPFQLSFFHPHQLYSDAYSVDGFRLDLIYGVNQDFQGIDLGVMNESRGSAHGFELGLDNRVAKDFGGVQISLFNEVKRDFHGLQAGLLANVIGRSCEGVQLALFYNNAEEEIQGLQIGIVNHTGSLNGIQIGIVNFNDSQRYKGFMPFINAAF